MTDTPRSERYGFVHVRLPADQYAFLLEEADRQRTGKATVMRQSLDLLKKQRETEAKPAE